MSHYLKLTSRKCGLLDLYLALINMRLKIFFVFSCVSGVASLFNIAQSWLVSLIAVQMNLEGSACDVSDQQLLSTLLSFSLHA